MMVPRQRDRCETPHRESGGQHRSQGSARTEYPLLILLKPYRHRVGAVVAIDRDMVGQ